MKYRTFLYCFFMVLLYFKPAIAQEPKQDKDNPKYHALTFGVRYSVFLTYDDDSLLENEDEFASILLPF